MKSNIFIIQPLQFCNLCQYSKENQSYSLQNLQGTHSQQISSKASNFSIYSPQIYNSLQKGQSLVQSDEKPKNKQINSIHFDSPEATINSSSNLMTSVSLTNSANYNSNKKNNTQNTQSNSKVSMFASQQIGNNVVGQTNISYPKQQQPLLNFSKDMNLLLHKKMMIQSHRRAESTKLTQPTQRQNSSSSQKHTENQFFFTKVDNSITFNNQQSTNQTINTSRSGDGQTPILTASVPSNSQLISSIDLNPQRDTKNIGERFFLNLANPVQKVKQASQIQKCNSLQENEPKASDYLKVGKSVSTCKSSQNSPNNYQVGDNIVPFSALIQSQQAHPLSNFSPQKQQRPSKVQICEQNNMIIYDQIKPVNITYLPQSFEQLQNNYQNKVESHKSAFSEYKNTTNNIHNIEQQQNQLINTKQSSLLQDIQLKSPPKVRHVSQMSLGDLQQIQKQEQQTLIPPTEEEAKQQFQKILKALQAQDQQQVLSQLKTLYQQIFRVKIENEERLMEKILKQQEQQKQKQRKEYNKNSNGNDSTSTSSLDDVNGASDEKCKKMQEEQKSEESNNKQSSFLEQQVFITDYIDINKDALFKLVKEYYNTQTNEPQKYMTLKEQQINLTELFAIQKWIQERLLEQIDEEKKARLKTEEQTSIMLLNQEKTIQIMENKWMQQSEQQRSSNNIQNNNTGQQKYKNSPQGRSSVNIIQQ